MTRRTTLTPRHALLGLLMRGPMHGYELHQQYELELGQVWRAGRSQVYGLLKDLEEAGQVEVRVEQQESRPARKIYSLTPAGRQAFKHWVRQPVVNTRDIRVLFLAKLYFVRQLGLDGLEELIEAQKAICRERADGIARRAAELSSEDFENLVLGFRHHQLEAIIEWLDGCCLQTGTRS